MDSPRAQAMTSLFDAFNQALAPGMRGRGRLLARARVAWPAAVGADLARHTEVLGLQGTLVVVGVRDRTRRDFLFHQRRTIVARMAQAGVAIGGVRLEDLPPALGPSRPAVAMATVPADPRTGEIADAALRAALDGLLHAVELRAREGT